MLPTIEFGIISSSSPLSEIQKIKIDNPIILPAFGIGIKIDHLALKKE
jgi:hypothetical protein